MNKEALDRAIAALRLSDVFLSASATHLNQEFDPKYDERSERLSFQIKNYVTESAVIEGESEDGEFLRIFRVKSELGVRFICQDEKDSAEPEVLAFVEGTMEADYEITETNIIGDQEALDTFALNNVSYHVWPYWREYVTSQLSRMNMPKVFLPMRSTASNK
ncbi:hypothetical protein [Pseudomonas putida]|uniref:hypothetical protein n=1 Tax=Pseudomonas putida TaxID=303 RepID=UPI0009537E54|nr:hypothetical protein [Pseudomonas putida]SIR95246.1 hypothetical protein SAMN05216501_2875 [Pseudomonas putida]